MQVPRAALEYLTREVNGLSADAQEKVGRILGSLDWSDVAGSRAVLVQAMREVLVSHAELSAQAAAEFYDLVREQAVGEPLGAEADGGYEPEATEGAVRAFVQGIVEGGSVERFNREVLDRVDRDVKRAANVSVARNAARDPLGPRYARVPSGAETCEFCLMLASRGFVYRTDGAAGHAHPGCDCRVVPGFPGTEVEGYDPDAYLRMWRKLEEMKADQVPVAQREAVLAAMRDRLMTGTSASPTDLADLYQRGADSAWRDFKRIGKTADAYEATIGAFLRDMGEAYGVELSGSYEANDRGRRVFARPDGFELWAARFIAEREGSVTFLPSDRSMYPDVRTELGLAEIKTPVSAGKVASRLKHAAEQLAAVEAEGGSVYLSLARMSEDGASDASRIAARFVEDGTIRNLFLISGSGDVTRMQ